MHKRLILLASFSVLAQSAEAQYPIFAFIQDEVLPTKTVFVTSQTYTADFGGYVAARNICNQLASDAGLPGTYSAWISDSVNWPSKSFIQSTVKYVDTQGNTIADDWADLTDGNLDFQISHTEQGFEALPNQVWTNTRSNGNVYAGATNLTCNNWSSTSGSYVSRVGHLSFSHNASWSDYNYGSCTGAYRFYCFEQ